MHNSFFNLTLEERQLIISKTADHMDVSEVVIEKDLWVCWLLEQLFTLPIQMVFKGGTSLSKVFHIIKRFSEDCDIKIDYRDFAEKEIDLEKTSRSQLKKISEQLKGQLKHYVHDTVLPLLAEKLENQFPDQEFEIILSEDGETLEFYYPSIMTDSIVYLRDHVLVEFGIRNSTEPCEKHQILPYLMSSIGSDIQVPKPLINTLSPIRTLWEKVTLIHVECHRERLHQTPERLSRHWYDLYMLNHSHIGVEALDRLDILDSVLEYKRAFFNASYANYDDCQKGKLRLIPSSENQEALAKDYAHMIDADMFYQTPPSFSEIIVSLKNLEFKINQKVLSV